MSSYNYDLHISIAQSNAAAQEQEKIRNAARRQQDAVNSTLRKTADEHEKVFSVLEEQDSNKIRDDEKNADNAPPSSQPQDAKKREKNEAPVEIVSDDKKGKTIDMVC